MVRHTARRALALVTALSLLGAAACGDDDPTGFDPAELVGSWNVTSFVAGAVDGIALGMTMEFTFTSNAYSFSITNDQLGFCDGASDCTDSGTYVTSASTVTLNPGTADEVTLNASLSGSTLTITGTVEGTAITAVLERI